MMFNGIDIGRHGILPIHNYHSLSLKHVTLKADDLANLIAIVGVEKVTNFGTNNKHLYLQGQPAPQELYNKYLMPCQVFFTFILIKNAPPTRKADGAIII
jgi:hypothetical protein